MDIRLIRLLVAATFVLASIGYVIHAQSVLVPGSTSTASATVEEQETQTTHLSAIETAVSTGDTKVFKLSGADGDVADDKFAICTAQCILTTIVCFNSNASADAYLKLTNATEANTTPGTTALAYPPILIPFAGSHNQTGLALTFTTAITGYFSTLPGATDATDVPNDEVSCVVGKR